MTPQVPTPDYPFAADEVSYDNNESGLAASNMQDAIDELASSSALLALFANKPMAATIGVPGAEVDDTITVPIQLKDLSDENLTAKGFVHVFLTTDEAGNVVYREAWLTEHESGGSSLILGSSSDDWAGGFLSDDTGAIEAVVNVQSNVAASLFLHVIGPLGNILATSSVIVFALPAPTSDLVSADSTADNRIELTGTNFLLGDAVQLLDNGPLNAYYYDPSGPHVGLNPVGATVVWTDTLITVTDPDLNGKDIQDMLIRDVGGAMLDELYVAPGTVIVD